MPIDDGFSSSFKSKKEKRERQRERRTSIDRLRACLFDRETKEREREMESLVQCVHIDRFPPVLFPVEGLYIPTTYVRTYTSAYFFINEIVAAGQTHSRNCATMYKQTISIDMHNFSLLFRFCFFFLVRFFRGEKREIKPVRSYPRLTERAGPTMANNSTEEDGKTTLAKGALVTLCCCILTKKPSEEKKRRGKKDWRRKYNQRKIRRKK